jgi:hypothetical protein
MLTGSSKRAQQAKKLGFVDLLVDEIGPGVRSAGLPQGTSNL